LRWPAKRPTAEAWHSQWVAAFDKQKLTEVFFREYQGLFAILEADFFKQTRDAVWAHDYALQFLNRCMFLYFVQRKRWLGDDPNFLKSFWTAYRSANQQPDSFFEKWLSVMFFEAFNNRFHGGHKQFPEQIKIALQLAPYLNGGLFEENDLDRRHSFTLRDERFLQVLTFLERYNFTVTEDTPLDQEVAVDAEMLGRVYESLVNLSEEADERGDAGIFYTPRTEIDLMCRLALVDHLSNHLGEARKSLLYEAAFAYAPEDKRSADIDLERENLWVDLDMLLQKVAVVDPACGSGSFLIGMLQVLDDLTERANRVLGRQETHYERRKRIIGESLYGVDVMRWAVEVAELRLWLQLVIETDFQPAELMFRPLLPNLSFKVRCGDSLVQELAGINIGHTRATPDIHASLKGRLTRLKGEKLKYYNNDKDAKFRSRESIEKEEHDIFRSILESRAHELENRLKERRQALVLKSRDMFGRESHSMEGAERREGEAEVKSLEVDLGSARNALEGLRRSKTAPFVWDVAFVEIFKGDREGFDIVVGNPPYVRQEKISDPNLPRENVTAENKSLYRAKLAMSVYQAYPTFFGYKASTGAVSRKMDAKSDLYIYFYFHALSLLNDKGSLCFITSNSWLDVGYGADLQEFLLKHCHVKMVLDNQCMRSFASADVNTVIALLSPPAIRRDSGSERLARFVMFKVPFEEVLSPVVFKDIETTSARRATPEYRVFPIRHDQLLEDGSEMLKDKDASDRQVLPTRRHVSPPLIKVARYTGNKWGGKYLRSPDIYWTIQERGRSFLGQLSEYLEGERYLNTGGADGFFIVTDVTRATKGSIFLRNTSTTSPAADPFAGELEDQYLIPLIKDVTKSDKSIEIQKPDAWCVVVQGTPSRRMQAYIKWGERQGYHHRSVTKNQRPWYKPTNQMLHGARLLVPRSFNDTFAIYYNPREYLSLRFYRLHLARDTSELPMLGYLNSTLVAFFLEVLGNKSMGQGVLEFFMADFLALRIPVVCTPEVGNAIERMKTRPIRPVWNEYGIEETGDKARRPPRPLADRQELDGAVYDALRFTKGERDAVYEAVITLVETRLKKAASLDTKERKNRSEAVRRTVGIWPTAPAGGDGDFTPTEK